MANVEGQAKASNLKRTVMQNRRRVVAQLYLKARPQYDIASQLGISVPTVSRDLKAITAEWRSQMVTDFHKARMQELAKINALENEYWLAWDRSKGVKESTVTEKAENGEGKPSRLKAQVKKEYPDGNPSFLAGVQWCISKRCELLGLNAPTRTDITSGGERLTPLVEIMAFDYQTVIAPLAPGPVANSLPSGKDQGT